MEFITIYGNVSGYIPRALLLMKIVSVMNLYLESIELLELGEIRHVIACEEP